MRSARYARRSRVIEVSLGGVQRETPRKRVRHYVESERQRKTLMGLRNCASPSVGLSRTPCPNCSS